MKRLVVLLAATLIASGLMAGPAFAHILSVTPPGTDAHHEVWVGTNPEVLFETPAPFKTPDPFTLFAPHAGGLNAACAGAESSPAADIRGPGGPGCPHGE